MIASDDCLDRDRVASALNCPVCRKTVKVRRVTHERAFFMCDSSCVEFSIGRVAGVPRVLDLIAECERSVSCGR